MKAKKKLEKKSFDKRKQQRIQTKKTVWEEKLINLVLIITEKKFCRLSRKQA
jgi:hypothetical protein